MAGISNIVESSIIESSVLELSFFNILLKHASLSFPHW